MGRFSNIAILIAAAVALLVSVSVFTVDERERVILFKLGKVVKDDFKPGLHWKPFWYNVVKMDGRILSLDVDPERFLTVEKKNVIVDSFVKWKIDDVKNFYTSVRGDQAQARNRLEQIIKDAMRGEFSKRTINEVVSGERVEIMDFLTDSVNAAAARIGVHVEDVRIKRVDLPDEVSSSVFRRMEAERTRVAKDFRSRGIEASERIKADADRQRQVLLAEAYRDAEIIRGEGDAKAAEVFALAYNRNKEFYSLFRSLEAYRRSFSGRQDVLLLQPDSEFFRYFNGTKGQ